MDVDNYQPLNFEFPDEDFMNISMEEEGHQLEEPIEKLYFDEALNTLGHGIKAILIPQKETTILSLPS